jgi:MFS transporter, DHA1 family, tetracycline resistance protein
MDAVQASASSENISSTVAGARHGGGRAGAVVYSGENLQSPASITRHNGGNTTGGAVGMTSGGTSGQIGGGGTARRRAIFFIFVTILIDSISFGIILPVLPALIMQLTGEGLGAAATYGGWLAFVFAAMQFFCAPVLGNLSDRYGRRPVLLFSMLALGLDYMVMGFAPGLEWLFIGRSIAGVAGATYAPAYAYIADVSPPEKRAQNFGVVGAAFGGGFILGPAIGGLLGTFGPRAPFFVAAGFALLNFTFGLFALPESLPPESRRAFRWSRANPLGTLQQMRKYPVVLGLAAAAFLWQVGHQVMPAVWSFYTMLKFDWSVTAVGYSLAAVGVVMAVSQGLLTRMLIPALGGERRAAMVGLFAGIAIYMVYAFATQGWMVYLGILAWSIGALAWPAINAIMSQEIPATAQGELQGGMASLGSLASIIGPVMMTQLFGYAASDASPVRFAGAPFVLAALLSLASAFILSRHLFKKPVAQTA